MVFTKGLKKFFQIFKKGNFKTLPAFLPRAKILTIDEVSERKIRRFSLYTLKSVSGIYEISSLKSALFTPQTQIAALVKDDFKFKKSSENPSSQKPCKIILFCSQNANNFDEVLLRFALRALICFIFAGVFVYFYVKNGLLATDLFFMCLFAVAFLGYLSCYFYLVLSARSLQNAFKISQNKS